MSMQTFGDRLRATNTVPLSGDARTDYFSRFRELYTHDPATSRWMSRERMEDRVAGQEMCRAAGSRAISPLFASVVVVAAIATFVWALVRGGA